jgi:histidinol-phosphate aminotransferase
MSSFFDDVAVPYIRDLPVYEPGKPVEELERELGIRDVVKLASNENPVGPSPLAMAAAQAMLARAHFYPADDAFFLRRALAERLGVAPGALIFGAGSNEIIYMLVHALCRPGQDEVLTHQYSFISYRLAAMAYAAPFVEAPASAELGCDVDALIAAMSPRTKVVLLANPNNPTGAYVRTRDLERILEALPPHAVLVVDEAYHEYAMHAGAAAEYPSSQRYQSEREPRVITLRTFSKIYGLASLRVGYGIGHPRVLGYVERVRKAFNVSGLAQAAALGAMDDTEHVARSQQVTRASLDMLLAGAERLGLRGYPSLANFVLVDVGRDAEPLYQALLQRGVIVRPLRGWGLPRHVRISAGTPSETERALAALAEVVG